MFVQSLSPEIRCSCIFLFGEGRGTFWEAAVLRGRHKGFFGEVGEYRCLFEISHTSNLFYIRKKSDEVEFFIWGKEFFFFGGGGSFMGGDIEVFFQG